MIRCGNVTLRLHASSTSAMNRPPFWVVLLVQLVSVAADALGQRAARKQMKNSQRHMLLGLTLVSSLQVFLILGILQFALPVSISGALYDSKHGSQALPCYVEVDTNGQPPEYCNSHACQPIECPAQGPFSMFRSIALHPLLLLNGLQSILYYVCEVVLYHQPLGVVLIVIAALTSSFVIVPLEALFGILDHAVDPIVMVLGIVGSLLCIIERKVTQMDGSIADMYSRFFCGSSSSRPEFDESHTILSSGSFEGGSASLTDATLADSDDAYLPLGAAQPVSACRSAIMIGVPFLGLSLTYSLWFVTQKIFNNQYRTNALGYTSIDQVLVPLYMWLFLAVVDVVPALKQLLSDRDEHQETFRQAIRVMWSKLFDDGASGFLTIFFYRLFANGRAVVYFYLGVIFDLNIVYVELTFVRIVLSWMASLAICAFAPHFLGLSDTERRTVFAPINIVLRLVGTGLVIAALLIGN